MIAVCLLITNNFADNYQKSISNNWVTRHSPQQFKYGMHKSAEQQITLIIRTPWNEYSDYQTICLQKFPRLLYPNDPYP